MKTIYTLSTKTKKYLKTKFPPKYDRVLANHIIINPDVPKDAKPPSNNKHCRVVGYIDNDVGLEALVVSINGDTNRIDGNIYNIPWSLDPTKFNDDDINDLLKFNQYTLTLPIVVTTKPAVI